MATPVNDAQRYFGPNYHTEQNSVRDFYQASNQERFAVTKRLVETGSFDLKNWTSEEEYPLLTALSCRDYETARFLLQNSADPLFKDQEGKNAFFYLPLNTPPEIAIPLLEEIERYTTLSPAEIWSMRDSKGQTPLFSIAPFLNEAFLNFLRLRNVDLRAVDNNQQSALYFAFNLDAVEILARLSPLDQVDRFGRSPLAHFINKGVSAFHAGAQIYYNIALTLMDHGANPDRRCLEDAFKGDRRMSRSLALRLLEKGEYTEDSVTKLGLAVQLHLPDQVKSLIKQGENPNWQSKESPFSLLEMAAMNERDILTFYYLLEKGAIPSENLIGPPLYRGLANIYRNEHPSVDERHQAIRLYLTDPTKIGQLLYASNEIDYGILCRELNIPQAEWVQRAPHQIEPSQRLCNLL